MHLSAAAIRSDSAQALFSNKAVSVPDYDPAATNPGIVHLGIGAFHRAHMAAYVDSLLASHPDWAIIGAGVRAPDALMRAALKAQDYLSTVIELDPKGRSVRRIGSMIDFVPVEADNASLIATMSRRLVA